MGVRTKIGGAALAAVATLVITVGVASATSGGPLSDMHRSGSESPGVNGGGSAGFTGSGVSKPGVAVAPGVGDTPTYAVAPDVAALPPCPMERFPCGFAPGAAGAPNTITVTGTSTIRTEPDQAIVTLGVQTQASDAADALRENAERMAAVLQALRALGIPDADIETAAVNLYPIYSTDGSGRTDGFSADNQISVTIHDLGLVGRAIDAAVGAGANVTSGVLFDVSDESRGRAEALRAAVADARQKAETLAAAAGARVGKVVSISESSSGFQPLILDSARGAMESAPTPINPPAVLSGVSVTVVFELIS